MKYVDQTLTVTVVLGEQDFIYTDNRRILKYVKDVYGNIFKPTSVVGIPKRGSPLEVSLVEESERHSVEGKVSENWKRYSIYTPPLSDLEE